MNMNQKQDSNHSYKNRINHINTNGLSLKNTQIIQTKKRKSSQPFSGTSSTAGSASASHRSPIHAQEPSNYGLSFCIHFIPCQYFLFSTLCSIIPSVHYLQPGAYSLGFNVRDLLTLYTHSVLTHTRSPSVTRHYFRNLSKAPSVIRSILIIYIYPLIILTITIHTGDCSLRNYPLFIYSVLDLLSNQEAPYIYLSSLL